MKTKEFIEKIIEGGYGNMPNFQGFDAELRKSAYITSMIEDLEVHLLNPLAWQAVGKVEKWQTCGKCKDPAIHNMHHMIDTLAEASQKPKFDVIKTIEEFLKTL